MSARRWMVAAGVAAMAAVVGVSVVGAQAGGTYDVSWFSIPGGGGTSSAGQYAITGAIGQPLASSSTGSTYKVTTGFFGGSSQRFRVVMAGIAADLQ